MGHESKNGENDRGREERGEGIDTANKNGDRAITLAMRNRHLEIVEVLAEAGARLKNLTPNDSKLAAKLLIDSSAGVNLADEYGQTPLHWAADKGNSEVAKLLIECGADPNVCTKNGSTPLHMAAYYGDKDLALLLVDGKEELAKILIDSGADTNVADEDGQTPLHIAAKKGYKEVVKLLIKEGADMDKADNNGKTPRHHMDWLK